MEVDFTEIKPGKYSYRHLLVFVDNFFRVDGGVPPPNMKWYSDGKEVT